MTWIQLGLIFITVIALSAGQILFKIAASSIEFSVARIGYSVFNVKLWIALIVYFIATFLWLYVLKTVPLKMAYPFVALAFFVVPVMSHFFLGELLEWKTLAGAVLIGLGVWVSTYSH